MSGYASRRIESLSPRGAYVGYVGFVGSMVM